MAVEDILGKIKSAIDGPLKDIQIAEKQTEIFKYFDMRDSGAMTRDDFAGLVKSFIELDKLLTGSNAPVPVISVKNLPDILGTAGKELIEDENGHFEYSPSINFNEDYVDEFLHSETFDASLFAEILNTIGHEQRHIWQNNMVEIINSNPEIANTISKQDKQMLAKTLKSSEQAWSDSAANVLFKYAQSGGDEEFRNRISNMSYDEKCEFMANCKVMQYLQLGYEEDARKDGIAFIERVCSSLLSSPKISSLASENTIKLLSHAIEVEAPAMNDEEQKNEQSYQIYRDFQKHLASFGLPFLKEFDEIVYKITETGDRSQTAQAYRSEFPILAGALTSAMSQNWSNEQVANILTENLLAGHSKLTRSIESVIDERCFGDKQTQQFFEKATVSTLSFGDCSFRTFSEASISNLTNLSGEAYCEVMANLIDQNKLEPFQAMLKLIHTEATPKLIESVTKFADRAAKNKDLLNALRLECDEKFFSTLTRRDILSALPNPKAKEDFVKSVELLQKAKAESEKELTLPNGETNFEQLRARYDEYEKFRRQVYGENYLQTKEYEQKLHISQYELEEEVYEEPTAPSQEAAIEEYVPSQSFESQTTYENISQPAEKPKDLELMTE